MPFPRFNLQLFKNEEIIHEEIYENKGNENRIECNCLGYNTIIDLETETLTRENEEFEFFLAIQKKCCTIHLKQENLEFDIQVDDCNLKKELNKITLEYTIETDDAKNKIVIIGKEE